MGSRGDCYDNAMAETFSATLTCELLARRRFRTQAEAKLAKFDWIEGWYNPAGGTRPSDGSPPTYEQRHAAA
jgi:putative transposase